MTSLKKQFAATPIATASKVIGLVTGVIGILAFGGQVTDYVGTFIVTNAELDNTEIRIVQKFEKEALTIRQVYIDDLIAQKTKISTLLGNAEKVGEIELYRIQIESINKRIEKLRGTR